MTRRRSFQNGCLMNRKGKWVIRWRERVPVEGGELRWKHRAETLGLVRNLTKGEAEKILRERLVSAGRRVPIQNERDQREGQHGRGEPPMRRARLPMCAVLPDPFLG